MINGHKDHLTTYNGPELEFSKRIPCVQENFCRYNLKNHGYIICLCCQRWSFPLFQRVPWGCCGCCGKYIDAHFTLGNKLAEWTPQLPWSKHGLSLLTLRQLSW